jgi:glucosamine--fructose-6-phosphate aminotransferase (isomerizing)
MASLLTQEASKLACLAYSGGQFRHGPMELVRPGFRAAMFESPHPDTALLDRRLADAILDRGGACAWFSAGRSDARPRDGQFVVEVPGIAEGLAPILNIVPIQLLQVPLAIARGFVPAQFLNASKVTTLE